MQLYTQGQSITRSAIRKPNQPKDSYHFIGVRALSIFQIGLLNFCFFIQSYPRPSKLASFQFMQETSSDITAPEVVRDEHSPGTWRDKITLTRKKRQYNTLPSKEVPEDDLAAKEKRRPRKSFDISVVKTIQGDGQDSSESVEHHTHQFRISTVKNDKKISAAQSCSNVPTLDKLWMEISITPRTTQAREYDPLIDIF